MKAVVIRKPEGPDGLEIVTLPNPEPGPDEILVRMAAASINYRDLLISIGAYRSRQKAEDLIPLSDGVGKVVKVGAAVSEFHVGDRVSSLFFRDWTGGEPDNRTIESDWGRDTDGMLCTLKVFKPHNVVKVPDYLSDIEAASLPCAALTAWNALIGDAQSKPGDTVLIQGTGGVALFALQFAKMIGAEVIATSSSDEKLERVRELGADHLINYANNLDWGKQALEITGGRGVDNVMELGGKETFKQSLISVRPGGTLSMIGVLSGATFGNALLPFVVSRKVRMQGVTVGSRADMQSMLRAMAAHQIKPVIDKVFPFEASADAFRHLKSGAHFGKVCIEI